MNGTAFLGDAIFNAAHTTPFYRPSGIQLLGTNSTVQHDDIMANVSSTGGSLSFGERIYARPEWDAAVFLRSKMSLSIQVAGILGNIVSLVVLCRPNMRKIPTSLYLIVLAIGDTLYLTTKLMNTLNRYYLNQFLDSQIWCKMGSHVNDASQLLSVWILVAMTAERLVAVRHPLNVTSTCSKRNTKIVVAVIILIACLLPIYNYWFIAFEEFLPSRTICDYVPEYYHIVTWVYAGMVTYIPIALLIYFNVTIIVAIRISESEHRALVCRVPGARGGNSVSHSRQVTLMVLAVSCVFVVCLLPIALYHPIQHTLMDHNDPVTYARYALARYACLLLASLNHAVNFILYMLTARRFRAELLLMLSHCAKVCRRLSCHGKAASTFRRNHTHSVISYDSSRTCSGRTTFSATDTSVL